MIKKFLAAALCLFLGAPCFAAGRYQSYYPQPMNHPHPSYKYEYRNDVHLQKCHTCSSQRTKTIAAVAGIAGVAAIISAIVD